MKRFVVVAIAVMGLICSFTHLFAQNTQKQELLRVLGISVDGNLTADASAIIANTGLKVGDEIALPGDQIGQAIRKLWQLKIFSDIQISVDRKIDNGIYLLVKVAEHPRFDGVTVSGNDEIDTDKIEKKVGFIRGQVLAPQDIRQIQKEIKKLYEEDGYLLATVDAKTVPSDSAKNRVMLDLTIDEGEEVKVRSISFGGNSAFDDSDLRSEMKETAVKKWWKIFTSGKFDKKKYEEDKKLIVKHYRKNGYRDAEISNDSIWYTDNRKAMNILIRVYEGAQYKIRNITWDGNTVYPKEVLADRLNIQFGEIYNAEKFEQNLRGNESQSDVSSLYLDNGYLTFNVEPKEIRVAEDSVDIHINVYERNKFKIGRVDIKGNTKTYDKVIRRELYTRPADYFSRAAIMRSLRQLQQLNYFNPEKLRPDYMLQPDGESVNLVYEVEEKSSDNINASVGYSEAFGVTGALGFTINNFAIKAPLTGGAGQVLNFEWQFGEGSRFRTFSIGFTEPWLMDTPTLLGVSLFDTRQIYNFDLQQRGASVRIGRRFRWPDDYFRGDWIANVQHNDVRDGRGIYREGVSSQFSLTQIISRNSVDNPIFPSSGSSVSLSVQMSGGPLLPGNINFHKWNFQSEWYLPMFGSNRITLYLNSQYGYIGEFYKDVSVPPIELFFMGGTGLGYIATTPLRGYEDQSIGPRNARETIIGGNAMTRQTAELRFGLAVNPIPIYLLGFVEGGNVFPSIAKANFFDLKRSAGFGARLQVPPIGLLGFDYGYGFDDVFPRDGKPDGWRFHFVFGKGF